MLTEFEQNKIVDTLILIKDDPNQITNGQIAELCDDDEVVSLVQRYKDHNKATFEVLTELVRILSDEQENRDEVS